MDAYDKTRLRLRKPVCYAEVDKTKDINARNNGNSDSSPDKALRLQQRKKINKRRKRINKNEMDNGKEESSTDLSKSDGTLPLEKKDEILGKEESSTDLSKSDGTLPLEKKDEIQTEDMDRVTADSKNTLIEKLREVPPNLYRTNYVVRSKWNEILLKAKRCTNPDEKERYLQFALTLCKEVAPILNLNAVCRDFVVCHFYRGVVQLCIYCAERIDPKNAASYYCINSEKNKYFTKELQEGYLAFKKRYIFSNEIYKEFTRMLDHSYNQNNPLTSTIPSNPGPFLQTASNAVVMPAKEVLHEIIDDALHAQCQTLHSSIYTWIERRYYGELIRVTHTSSFHTYLNRVNAIKPIWNFYKINKIHVAAVNILKTLATLVGSEISLAKRVDYLAWAVVYMRSDQTGYASYLLCELEYKLEVARIQQQILETISNQQNLFGSTIVTDAKLRLNSSLLLSQLDKEYVESLQLWECKLAVIHCMGYQDDILIKKIWTKIIDNELKNATESSNEDKMTILMCKIKLLAKKYSIESFYFPIDFLVEECESIACRYKVTNTSIINSFFELGVARKDLLDIYDYLIKTGKIFHFWLTLDDLNHLSNLYETFGTSCCQSTYNLRY